MGLKGLLGIKSGTGLSGLLSRPRLASHLVAVSSSNGKSSRAGWCRRWPFCRPIRPQDQDVWLDSASIGLSGLANRPIMKPKSIKERHGPLRPKQSSDQPPGRLARPERPVSSLVQLIPRPFRPRYSSSNLAPILGQIPGSALRVVGGKAPTVGRSDGDDKVGPEGLAWSQSVI